MPNFRAMDSGDLRYYAQDVECTIPEATELLITGPGDVDYEENMRQAFNFLRRNDDGRYSSRMKMRVLNAAETAESARESGRDLPSDLPGLLAIRRPFGYDEDTEVKTGGWLAALVIWPEDAGRVMLAVQQPSRRCRMGSLLMYLTTMWCQVPQVTAWVNSTNRIGQHFLISRDFNPTGFNRSGGISYGWGNAGQDDGVEDHIDPLDIETTPSRVRRELLRQQRLTARLEREAAYAEPAAVVGGDEDSPEDRYDAAEWEEDDDFDPELCEDRSCPECYPQTQPAGYTEGEWAITPRRAREMVQELAEVRYQMNPPAVDWTATFSSTTT